MDRISELPKEILGRILYFLSQKEAVRTSVLSKSWRDIWCTRPNLDFSSDNFKGQRFFFISIMDKALQRYYDRSVCVEEFHLRIQLGDLSYDFDHESAPFLEKWIPLLTNTGTKKFRLSIRTRWNTGRVQLPPAVFGAQSLHDLHVEKFSLDEMAIQSIVFLKNLKSLRLEKVCIEDEIFEKIISNCIFIETLVVKICKRLRTIKVNELRNLKYFFFKVCQIILAHGLCPIEVHPPSLEIIDIRDGNLRFYKGADFHNLEDLSLCNVKSSFGTLVVVQIPESQILEHFRLAGSQRIPDIY